jgi:hypothetical protein
MDKPIQVDQSSTAELSGGVIKQSHGNENLQHEAYLRCGPGVAGKHSIKDHDGTPDYRESFSSRVDSIRRDGPSLFTGVLEKADNSYDWGKAKNLYIDYDCDRMTMNIRDDGENGFGSMEAIKRFFTLGNKNENATSDTIGKYGKGGYSSIISLGRKFNISSYFEEKEHVIGTDIVTMCRDNVWGPTEVLTTEPSSKVGTEFMIELLPKYQLALDQKNMIRHLSRAYHKIPMDITVNGETVEKKFPYGTDLQSTKTYDIFWRNGEFVCQIFKESQIPDSDEEEEEEGIHVAKLKLLVLRNKVMTYDNLGPVPGLDVYRLDRLCNSDRPIHNLGDVGENISMGSGSNKGERCHMTLEYNPSDLTDELNMDDCVGLTSNKEISEDTAKWNKDLLELLEEKSREVNKMYEGIISTRLNSHEASLKKVMDDLSPYLSNHADMTGEQLLIVKSILKKYSVFDAKGYFKYNEDSDEWDYPEIREGAANSRRGTNLRKYADQIVTKCQHIIKNAKILQQRKKRIKSTAEKHTLEIADAEKFLDYEDKIKQEEGRLVNKHITFDDKSECYGGVINATDSITKLKGVTDVSKYEDIKILYQKKLEEEKMVEEKRLVEEEENKALEEVKRIAEEKLQTEEKRIAEEKSLAEEKIKSLEEKEHLKEEKRLGGKPGGKKPNALGPGRITKNNVSTHKKPTKVPSYNGPDDREVWVTHLIEILSEEEKGRVRDSMHN